ncbi:hypothetical protein ACFQRB_19085 [Halobaculum litoreum]|uniref:DUF5518 domain-containing protein n=1 Tax=Halobaculum litoreum TaxID=3031998 RepID=A0ABD5XS95_9EURY
MANKYAIAAIPIGLISGSVPFGVGAVFELSYMSVQWGNEIAGKSIYPTAPLDYISWVFALLVAVFALIPYAIIIGLPGANIIEGYIGYFFGLVGGILSGVGLAVIGASDPLAAFYNTSMGFVLGIIVLLGLGLWNHYV